MSVLYDDIGELVTNDPAVGDGTTLGVVTDAALVTDGDRIVWLGPKAGAPEADQRVAAGTGLDHDERGKQYDRRNQSEASADDSVHEQRHARRPQHRTQNVRAAGGS